MLGTDTPHGLSDRACHTGSGAFSGGTGASTASAEPNRARQLAREEVAFGLCLRHPRCISQGSRLLQIVLNLGEPPAVRLLRARIEHFAGIACIPKPQARLRDMSRVGRETLLDANKIQDVELSSRVGEQPRQVPYTPHISQAYDLSLEDHRPVLAFAPEDTLSVSVRGAGHSRTRR